MDLGNFQKSSNKHFGNFSSKSNDKPTIPMCGHVFLKKKKTIKKDGVLREIWTFKHSNETIVDLKNSKCILLKKFQCTTFFNT
jgi:hypothetical protein